MIVDTCVGDGIGDLFIHRSLLLCVKLHRQQAARPPILTIPRNRGKITLKLMPIVKFLPQIYQRFTTVSVPLLPQSPPAAAFAPAGAANSARRKKHGIAAERRSEQRTKGKIMALPPGGAANSTRRKNHGIAAARRSEQRTKEKTWHRRRGRSIIAAEPEDKPKENGNAQFDFPADYLP
ncbi:MAG: hypothetical protein ACOX41_03325 [Anaerovoracaceae bacterium]